MNASDIIKQKQGSILDVRTHAEYAGGHATDSKNIPLQEITARMDEVKAMKQPIVLCCASGARSEQATQFLRAQGIDCVNAGSWLDVNYFQSL